MGSRSDSQKPPGTDPLRYLLKDLQRMSRCGIRRSSADEMAGLLEHHLRIRTPTASDVVEARRIYAAATQTVLDRVRSQTIPARSSRSETASWIAAAATLERFLLDGLDPGMTKLDVRNEYGNAETVRVYERKLLQQIAAEVAPPEGAPLFLEHELDDLILICTQFANHCSGATELTDLLAESAERIQSADSDYLVGLAYHVVSAFNSYFDLAGFISRRNTQQRRQLLDLADETVAFGALWRLFASVPQIERYALRLRTNPSTTSEDGLAVLSPADVLEVVHCVAERVLPFAAPDAEATIPRSFAFECSKSEAAAAKALDRAIRMHLKASFTKYRPNEIRTRTAEVSSAADGPAQH